MNNKITSQRLKTFFVYDFIKMVAITAIVLLCVIIIFNYVGRRPTEAQTFSVLVDNVEVVTGDEQEAFYTKVSYGSEDKKRIGLSHNVLSGNVTAITPSSENPMQTLMQTYISLKDDDVLIAGKTIATYYLGRNAAMEIDYFLTLLNNFLYVDNGFYKSELDSPSDIDVDAVKNYFLKTYKNVHKNSISVSLSSAIIAGQLYLRRRKSDDCYRVHKMTRKVKTLIQSLHLPVAKTNRIPIICDESGILFVPPFGVREEMVQDSSSNRYHLLIMYSDENNIPWKD